MGRRRNRKWYRKWHRNRYRILKSILLSAVGLAWASFFFFGYMSHKSNSASYDHETIYPNLVYSNDDNVYEKIKKKAVIRYLIIGESIGQGDGAETEYKWFNQLSKKLEQNNEVVSFPYKITTQGSTVFNGWFDFQNNALNPDIDLVFICFGQNDQTLMSENQYGAVYENLIHKVNSNYKKADIYTIIESSIQSEKIPRIIKELSAYYGLTVLDTRIAFKQSNQDYNKLSNDGTHPNNEGYTLYANYTYHQLMDKVSSNPVVTVDLDKKVLYPQSADFQEGNLTSAFAELKDGAQKSTVSFTGTFVGLSINKGPSGGKFRITIDGKFIEEISSYNKFAITHKVLVADGLSNTEHTLEIEPLESDKTIDLKGFITQKNKD